MFDINVKGLIAMCAATFPHLKKNGGTIINFGSDAGLASLGIAGGHSYYGATKGAVHTFTRHAAAEFGPHDVRVNTVVPAIWTPMYDHYRERMSTEELEQHEKAMTQYIPLGGKLGDTLKDIAPVMLFLVSDASRFITGQIIAVNGGIGMVR